MRSAGFFQSRGLDKRLAEIAVMVTAPFPATSGSLHVNSFYTKCGASARPMRALIISLPTDSVDLRSPNPTRPLPSDADGLDPWPSNTLPARPDP